MSDPRLQVEDLNRDAGYWTATITIGSVTVGVDRKYGSWMQLAPKTVTTSDGDAVVYVRREVPRWIASALQDAVRPTELREAKIRHAAKVAQEAVPA